MERMSNHYENRLWTLLEKEKLADLSQFHQPGFFDEVPLFSRESDIAFLSKDNAASEIVLGFALKFLNAVIAYEQHRTGYFAAITIWSHSSDPLVPHLFVSCGNVRELKEKLVLNTPSTPFANQMKKLAAKVRLGEKFETLEDTVTVPDETRVFIAPQQAPYQGFATLTAFCKRTRTAR
jgi:hypothetical protein